MKRKKIILAGGTGFVGKILVEHFAQDDVVVLSRNSQAESTAKVVQWDGKSIGAWCEELEGADVIINLSGRSVDCRYTDRNKKLIMDSRIDSTRIIGKALSKLSHPPKLWMNLSTATIYKHSYDKANDEASGIIGASPEAHDAFSIEVAQTWEKVFDDAHTPKTRKITLRSAIVFGEESGGVYKVLRRLIKFGLGGAMGDGRQWVSWIHRDDFCSAVDWLIAHEGSKGVYNLSAPKPIRNNEMMRVFRTVLGVSFGFPTYNWMLIIGAFFMRTERELVIKSRYVIPARLLEEGYRFRYDDFDRAIADLSKRSRQIPCEHKHFQCEK